MQILRVTESHARRYRHTWRASVFSSFLNPILLLAAMGVGLGSLVDRQGGVEGMSYLAFLAPALLANTAMNTAAGECTYPVMAGFRWLKTYVAALSTPVTVSDLVLGQLSWAVIRVAQVATTFAIVMAAFSAVDPLRGLAAVAPSVLTGAAFAALIMWYTTSLDREVGLSSLFRFGIIPMFLFSGTFFPVSQLPDWLQPLAYLTPLWHGVEMARAIALDLATPWPWWVHAGYLAALAAVGAFGAIRRLERRMIE